MTDIKRVSNKYERVQINRLNSKEHFSFCDYGCDCVCSICGDKLIEIKAEEDRRIFTTLPYVQIEQRHRSNGNIKMHETCFRAFTVMCYYATGGTDVSAHEMASAVKELEIVTTPRKS